MSHTAHGPPPGVWASTAGDELNRVHPLSRRVGVEGPQCVWRSFVVTGCLPQERLLGALGELARRHEILRTRLAEGDAGAGPRQVVRDEVEPDLTAVQISTEPTPGERTRQEVRSFLEVGFGLGVVPLWRTLLVTLDDRCHVVVLSMHPAIADAATLAAVAEELFALCAAASDEGAGHRVPAVAGQQHGHHAACQRPIELRSSREREAYWSRVLQEPSVPAQLPSYGKQVPGTAHRHRGLRVPLSADVLAMMQDTASRSGRRPEAVLLTAFAALLYRYGVRGRFTFGHTVSFGGTGDGAQVVGPRSIPVPLQTELDGDVTFAQALQAVGDQLEAHRAHASPTYQQLEGRAGGSTESSRAPRSLVMDCELDLPLASSYGRLGVLEVTDHDVLPLGSQDDVQVTARRLTSGTVLDWSYRETLFSMQQIDQAARHFVQLLRTALCNPEVPVARLPYLSAADQEEIRERWNLRREPTPGCSVTRLVEDQAARTPDAVAVEFQSHRLDYAGLGELADQLARRLVAAGAERGQLVGLCLDRSTDLVIGVLGILKAGCAVVPLDAAYPPDRLSFMVQDAGISIVVTARSLLASAPAVADLFAGLVKVLTDVDAATSTAPATPPLPDVAPDDIAYCIYTSGSTGRPKGVAVAHGALVNLVLWHRTAWLSEPGTRTLLYSPISFDVSFHEILAGLATGATLVQVDEETRRNPMALLDFAREQQVAKWYLPFVALQQVAQAAQTAAVPAHLVELIVGGELLRITPEIRAFAERTGCTIHNHYGSTECIDVATHTLSGDPRRWPSVVPIGRANVRNMNLFVLDENRAPVPVGVVGELYAEGDCLAIGYHGQPALTAERFSQTPFGIHGDRLYRLGDLGRYLPDGTTECLGRVDDQVKIRGFRVEPAEVEAVLAEQQDVAACVVTVRTNGPGRSRLAAYVVPEGGSSGADLEEALRSRLAEQLPEHMCPTEYVLLEALPLTPSGKLDVRGLPDPRAPAPTTVTVDAPGAVARIWAEVLGRTDIPPDKTFFELGGDSISLVRAHQQISAGLRRPLPVDVLFRHPTLGGLTRFLEDTSSLQAGVGRPLPAAARREDDRDIAIVGMACRVPGAEDLDAFWRNLRAGVESVTPLSPDATHVLEPDQTWDQHFVPAAAVVAGSDLFDAEFFGYSAAEAAVIDPQQRLFLECAWEAVEDAGIDVAGERVGVWAGASLNTYLVNNVLPAKLGSRTFLSHRHFTEATELRIEQGNAGDHLPARVSFKLDLRGPSVNVQTTCSTSLVAVHLAAQALLAGDCDTALAGGVSIITPQNTGYLWREGMMLSSDGHCRAFDAAADGTVFGNGLGVVVLKRLSAALADGDRVYAVVKGSAVNNDGAGKMDYSAPSAAAQADVIRAAHERAGVTASSISYVEAHGTGTRLGDPIEIAALSEAFARGGPQSGQVCVLGSVKTNLGHLDEAAGVVGLIKTALSLHHRELPPTLHFRSPNPLSGLAESPFRIDTTVQDWRTTPGRPRRAGVSSFGMGGTNCHVVLEEAPSVAEGGPPVTDRATHVLPVSARTEPALRANLERYAERLKGQDARGFADFCHSAATGRRHLERRVAIRATDGATARERIAALLKSPTLDDAAGHVGQAPPAVAFAFTGQGSQHHGMARSLYENQPVFRAALDHCDVLLRPELDRSLVSVLYDPAKDPTLHQTWTAQPALVAVGYALSQLWSSWGVRPDLLLGHSIGEYVAACVAGVFSIEDALRLVCARGRIMQGLPAGGAMAQVGAGVGDLLPYLADVDGAVAVAAVNAPDVTVLSGAGSALAALCGALEADGVHVTRLSVDRAFHSPLMQPVLAAFQEVARTVQYSAASLDIISTVTGSAAQPHDLSTPEYWIRHVVEPVQFDGAVRVAEGRGTRLFVELGPRAVLSGLGRRRGGGSQWLPSLTPADPEAAVATFGRLHVAGVPVDWAGFDAPFARRRVPVPTYAFQRSRHWLEGQRADPQPPSGVAAAPRAAQGRAAEQPQLLVKSWQPLPVRDQSSTAASRRIAVIDDAACPLASQLAELLRASGDVLVETCSTAGTEAGRTPLARALQACDAVVLVPGPSEPSAGPANLLALARTVLAAFAGRPGSIPLWLVAPGPGPEGAVPSHCGIGALARTLNAEHPELLTTAVRVLDVRAPADLRAVAQLVVHGACAEDELLVDAGRVLRPRLQEVPHAAAPAADLSIRTDGTYLITGGTGGLGLRLALAVAGREPARLVLVSRSGEVAAEDQGTWATLLASGADIQIARADVADEDQMRAVITGCGDALRGVFHCAGALHDGILLRQDDAAVDAVLRPKVTGSWVLHQLTQDQDLDFLVLFSSLASVLGYRGQGAYAVANEFLDELARSRSRQGLPALSVSWGSWAEAGMTARLPQRLRARLLDEGEHPIAAEVGVQALAALLATGLPHAAAVRMDWDRYVATQPRSTAMVQDLVSDCEPAGPTGDRADFAQRLRALRPEQARCLLRDTVTAAVHRLLGNGIARVDPSKGFEELGVDSLGALDLRTRLQDELGCALPATVVFERPCVDDLVEHLEQRFFAADIALELAAASQHVVVHQGTQRIAAATSREPGDREAAGAPVAIIGMSCRLPGADSPDELWRLLLEGRDAVRDVPADRWPLDRWYDASRDVAGRMYVRRAAFLDDVTTFDAAFFGISPREAASMDPRHRMLLESAWTTVESAGLDVSALRGSDTGVFLGCDEFLNDYLRQTDKHLGDEPYLATGTTLSFAAGRVSYKLGLHGPSIVAATACSSSLVALHSAVRAIRHGDCTMAIVGGAKLMLAPEETVQLCQLSALAPDGISKAFSAAADGFGRGEGVVTLLLKRLDAAQAEGDPVLAVVRGSAVNHGGPSAGLTVPNGSAQVRLIRQALADAGVAPADVTYLEAHGTGTQLGDPIEVNALGEALGRRRDPLLIGSVKANIGHLEEAAGLAGVVKTVLLLRHGVIPPQIHSASPNDKIDWDGLRVQVPRTATPWPVGAPRLAGVSSFGMSGTNAHVVLEAYQQAPVPDGPRPEAFVFPFSARDETDLTALLAAFAEALTDTHDPASVAHTLQAGRRVHQLRWAAVAADTAALRDRLLDHVANRPDGPGVFRGGGTGAAEAREVDRMLDERDLAGLARAWCAGRDVAWARLSPGPAPRRLPLPTYPFKRSRHWLGEKQAPVPLGQDPVGPVPGHAPPVAGPTPATDPGPLEVLREHVAGLLGMPPHDLAAAAPFDELGMDSLVFMRVSQFVRERYGVVVSFQQLTEEAQSLQDLARMVVVDRPPTTTATVPATPVVPAPDSGPSGPPKPRQRAERLTAQQAGFLTELVAAYTARTVRSKAEAEGDRATLANCRMPPWQPQAKEMAYPIIVERAAGARFWDVDGNEYVDISMGYGVHLFGHRPSFVVDALRAQLDTGFPIGPQASQAGRVARLLCELTGMQRAAFCNSGTEAVMAALRFARATTGRTRFVMFEGSYHGWSDGTLALPAGDAGAMAMARGVGAGAMDDVVVLEYGSQVSLETIRSLGPELAAVLVEPVQSRRPDLQPVEFLKELRELTRAAGVALVFDEVITGFRVDPGGAQAWSGVRADIVTYGKVLGGGMPVGAVAGSATFLDSVDGGAWQYGDDSAPAVPTTFFGGTFNKNPLTMAAAEAVLTHLVAAGPQLQRDLARRVAAMADDFNAFCREEGFPLQVVHFSSLFRFIGEGDYSLRRYPLDIDLFFHLMALRGIYVLETRVCFLSTAHTDQDVQFVLGTAKSCLRTLRASGFLPAAPTDPPSPGPARSRLCEDARLDPGLVPPRSSPVAVAQHVLLTGATGFLGAHLTADLLQSTQATIHCLVRAGDAQQARDRVLHNLREHGRLDEAGADRIVGIPADLTRPRLGLSEDDWARLADTVDAILHNGAQVNSLLPYERLRAANVGGTRELLGLAFQGRSKAFHQVSSDAVFDAYGYHRQFRIYEDQPLAHAESLYGGGYAESKWVADKLVENARAAGLAASIYRPGMLTGATSGGCGQIDDFFARFLRGIIQLGVCPELDATIDFAPVDLVSRRIVRLTTGPSRTYHLTHPDPISYEDFVEAIREAGYPLEVVPLHVWDATLARIRYEHGNALYPLLPLFTESADPVFRMPRMDVRNTAAATPGDHTAPLRELVATYLRRFSEAGLVPMVPVSGVAR